MNRLSSVAPTTHHDGPAPLRHWLLVQLGLSVAGWTFVVTGLYCAF